MVDTNPTWDIWQDQTTVDNTQMAKCGIMTQVDHYLYNNPWLGL